MVMMMMIMMNCIKVSSVFCAEALIGDTVQKSNQIRGWFLFLRRRENSIRLESRLFFKVVLLLYYFSSPSHASLTCSFRNLR